MASTYTPPVQLLIDELGRLPGIGPKSAQRIAFHLLKVPDDDAARLAHAISDAKARVRFCERCFNVSEGSLCPICSDDGRDSSMLCVVEESRDIVAVEKTGEFRGRYHVLLGAMSPLEGIGPEQLKIRELVARIDFLSLHTYAFHDTYYNPVLQWAAMPPLARMASPNTRSWSQMNGRARVSQPS